jgi:hypothetical protein
MTIPDAELISTYAGYRQYMIGRFWKYQRQRFPEKEKHFEQPFRSDTRPPVFLKGSADHNVLLEPGTSSEKRKEILQEIPVRSRHRWFGSMTSSQALAQSIFGNLKAYDQVQLLNGLLDDDGKPLFGKANPTAQNLRLEHNVTVLGEATPTSVDVFISGHYQVAIECKLSEQVYGSCSRPRLGKKASNYDRDHCDGSYTPQRNRLERCSLSERGVRYWELIPQLFRWRNDADQSPCPINKTYQLVRNVLAACVHQDGKLYPENGHAVLIYDERNPEFQEGGKAFKAFEETRAALRNKGLLRKCSWQRILDHLRIKGNVMWLTKEVTLKYGL